jgi:hypothetical protein
MINRFWSVNEQRVSASISIALAALDSVVQARDSDCVGPGYDKKLSILPGSSCGTQLLHHFGHRNDCFAGNVPTFFWKDLILDVKPSRPGAFPQFYGSLHIKRTAISCVRVRNHRPRGGYAYPSDVLGHLGLTDKPEIGLAKANGRGRIAAYVQCVCAGLFGKAGCHGVMGAEANDLASRKKISELLRYAHVRLLFFRSLTACSPALRRRGDFLQKARFRPH